VVDDGDDRRLEKICAEVWATDASGENAGTAGGGFGELLLDFF
jgi:hypothetical protein